MTRLGHTRCAIVWIDYAIQPGTRSRRLFPVRLHTERRVFYFRRHLWRDLEHAWHSDKRNALLARIMPFASIDVCYDKESGVILLLDEFKLTTIE